MRFFRNKLTRLLSFFLFLVLLASFITQTAVSAEGSYDYSRPASSHNVTLNSADILERYLGAEISDAERGYLSLFGGLSLTYNDGITTDKIICDYDGGALTVTAYEYSYVGANGTRLTWRPVSASVGSDSVNLTKVGDGYTATLHGVAEDESTVALVKYALTLTVRQEDMALVVNKAYRDAPVWESTIALREVEYRESLLKYESDLAGYNAYLRDREKYETDLALYRSYLIAKRIYDDKLAEYNAYLLAEAKYAEDLAKFNAYGKALKAYNTAYAEYLVYLAELSDYNSKLAVYNERLAKLETAKAQLGIIDTAKTRMTSLSRDVYSAIMGSLVSEVLVANKDLLTSPMFGADPAVIEAAETATLNLRVLLPTYFSLESEEEKYAYYSANYTHFRDNLTRIAQALDELYRNRAIRSQIREQDRDEKYAILVAQLALIAGALSGGDIDSYDGSYKLSPTYKIEYDREKLTLFAILENKEYIPKNISPIPLAEGYPTLGAEPIAPPEKAEPKAPAAVTEPARPEAVAHPGNAPLTVPEPTPPIPVTEPISPTPPDPAPELTALVGAYNRGELTEREEPDTDFTFEVYKTVTKKLFGVHKVTVIFHGTSGEVLETVSVDNGTGVEFSGVLPSKAEDARAVYTFFGWQSADGTPADLTAVDTDLDLFPYFSEDIKSYPVTFVVDGSEYTYLFPYGTIPDFGRTPSRADFGNFRYTFLGWDTAPVPVTGAARYTAAFTEEYIVPFGDTGAYLSETADNYTVNARGARSLKIDLSYLIEKATAGHSVRGIILDLTYGRITLPYTTLLSMKEAHDTVISLEALQLGGYAYTYRVSLYNKESGAPAVSPYKLSAAFVSGFQSAEGCSLFRLSDGTRATTPYTYSAGLVRFSAISGCDYTFIREYSVNAVPTDTATVTVLPSGLYSGAEVALSVTPALGYKIVAVRVLDASGAEIPVRDGYFVMPNSDVTVAVETAPIEYTVTFMDGTRILSTGTYKHGEIPTPPTAPTKLGEGYYVYEFTGWNAEITAAVSDAVYYAVYTVTPLPEPEDTGKLQISESIMRLLVAAAVAVFMLIFTVIPSVVICSVMYARYRKKKIRKKAK